MKEKTAVEWFYNELKNLIRQSELTDMKPSEFDERELKLINQAKAMESKKHIGWNKFLETEKTLGISNIKTIERIQWYYNQYF